MTHKNQKGFHVLYLALVVVVIGAVGFAGYRVATGGKDNQSTKSSSTTSKTTSSEVTWMQTADGYKPSSTPPACPTKIVSNFPADITKVTSVLYPGQLRGGNYKPHGGLRFDSLPNNSITVVAPFDGVIIDGSRYIADSPATDVQYTFDVMNSCGMMFRIGHLLTLPANLQTIANTWPAAVPGGSQTTNVKNVKIKAGDVMATAVGTTTSGKNVFFDWGVYNWNKPNAVSADTTWLQDPQHQFPLAKHAICWFDQLSTSDEATIKALPAGDPTNGKNSDYCK